MASHIVDCEDPDRDLKVACAEVRNKMVEACMCKVKFRTR